VNSSSGVQPYLDERHFRVATHLVADDEEIPIAVVRMAHVADLLSRLQRQERLLQGHLQPRRRLRLDRLEALAYFHRRMSAWRHLLNTSARVQKLLSQSSKNIRSV
jgi:hypothetical protein